MDDMERWMQRLASMPAAFRSVALLQLLRIEQEGAFSGLVGGAPAVAQGGRGRSGAAAASSAATAGEEAEDGADDEEPGGGRQAGPQLKDPRDRRAVTEIVNGTTRWRRRLDFTLTALCGRPLAELDPPLAALLRMGLYELAEMKTPAHVINEYVELAKRVMHRGAGAVANATLRNVVRGMEAGTLPQPPAPAKGMTLVQAADALALGASHPTWMVQGWLQQYGPAATMALLQRNNVRPSFALRLAPGSSAEETCQRLAELGAKARPSRFLPQEFIVVEEGMQALLASGLVQRGEAQVQDEAAGLVVALLDPQQGEHILDACAAPGGKTLFVAARMQGRGSIVAMDAASSRLAALRETVRRQGYSSCVRMLARDLRRYAREAAAAGEAAATGRGAAGDTQGEAAAADGGGEGGDQPRAAAAAAQRQQQYEWRGPPFDRVLVDAPCSGTGVLAKRADLRWRRTPQQVEQLVALQAQLLDAAASLVAPGGLLVYSTCSIERAENEDQVAAFLARHDGVFALQPPPAAAGLPADCLSGDGCLTMLPHVHGTDGAFAARLRRAG
ncbi:hypothetical protein ABPG75_002841 [Micractinium tetrahymenae]